ncbi:MAG: hypothetical protein VX777_01355 [Chlamydiota bacterium]|nr:hypothetical protein [Chlamydiota bacterium]
MPIQFISMKINEILKNNGKPLLSNPYVISVDDNRHWFTKIYDKLKASTKELICGLTIVLNRTIANYRQQEEFVVPSEKQAWDHKKKGLFLCIHGLQDHPSVWKYHIKLLKKLNLEVEIKVPYVRFKGNCSLETAAKPILHLLLDYIKSNPGKPICILGVSNGARIADFIDLSLRDVDVNIKISTIAGAHYGSTKMNYLNKWAVTEKIFDEYLRSEMQYGSHNVRDVISSMRKKISVGSRSYDFYATTEDYIVTPFNSSLPIINQNENYYLLHGEGHASIVWKTRKHQIDSCTEWMRQFW